MSKGGELATDRIDNDLERLGNVEYISGDVRDFYSRWRDFRGNYIVTPKGAWGCARAGINTWEEAEGWVKDAERSMHQAMADLVNEILNKLREFPDDQLLVLEGVSHAVRGDSCFRDEDYDQILIEVAAVLRRELENMGVEVNEEQLADTRLIHDGILRRVERVIGYIFPPVAAATHARALEHEIAVLSERWSAIKKFISK